MSMNEVSDLKRKHQHEVEENQEQENKRTEVDCEATSTHNKKHRGIAAQVDAVFAAHEHKRQVVKQQQQRLLLLRHAAKCPHSYGHCPITPRCAKMKVLWNHILTCGDKDCKVQHCISSRHVLSHYSKCKNYDGCEACRPVREAIRRNFERSRDIVN